MQIAVYLKSGKKYLFKHAYTRRDLFTKITTSYIKIRADHVGSQKTLCNPSGNDDSRLLPIGAHSFPSALVGVNNVVHVFSACTHHTTSSNTPMQNASKARTVSAKTCAIQRNTKAQCDHQMSQSKHVIRTGQQDFKKRGIYKYIAVSHLRYFRV